MRLVRQSIVRAVLALGLLLTTFVWAGSAAAAEGAEGAVYALTNATSGNAVLVWNRAADGSLTATGSYATGGLGTGGGLGSQGAVILSQNNQLLFAVNAGSNDISAFKVNPDGLTLVSRVPSGGTMPTSLTVYKKLLYVLNAGGSGNITGFEIASDGTLAPIADSTRILSGSTTAPGQIGFSPDGKLLVVVERATQTIDTFVVGADGRASNAIAQHSSGATPFGFAFGHRGQLFVSEAAGVPGGSSASSYTSADDGALGLISASVATHQGAACWLVVTNDGRYAYTANAGSGSVSGFSIDQDGSIALLNADGRTGTPGANPTDMALSHNSQFLYVRMGRSATIAGFAVQADGSLIEIPGADGLPATAVGLIAR
jgi:6-phosphogluconolactonase (cycloisomerase 2 family)